MIHPASVHIFPLQSHGTLAWSSVRFCVNPQLMPRTTAARQAVGATITGARLRNCRESGGGRAQIPVFLRTRAGVESSVGAGLFAPSCLKHGTQART
jgi:hypothetical protein